MFTIESIHWKTRSRARRKRVGMTLIELMIASAIGSLVALIGSSLFLYTGRCYAAIANYVDLDHRSQIALDTMSQQIRETVRLTSFTADSLTFEDSDGGSLKYQYDSNAKTLTRYKNGVADSKPLLTECDFIKFDIFQRNPIGGTYDQYPTAAAATCKLVQLKWVCSRKMFGVKAHTESVQSAKIVIRKQ